MYPKLLGHVLMLPSIESALDILDIMNPLLPNLIAIEGGRKLPYFHSHVEEAPALLGLCKCILA